VVAKVAFSPDGKAVLTGSWDRTAQLWDPLTGRPLVPPLRHQGPVVAVAFSPDGTNAVTGSADKTARLWDMSTGRPIGPPLRHDKLVYSVAFSPDGRSVLTGCEDGTAQLWDVATGRATHPLLRHQGQYVDVAFSPDGTTAVTCSRDRTARLWDVATGQPLGPPLQHGRPVLSVAFSPDGKAVVTGGLATDARLWEVADVPDDPERVALWIETITGLALDGPEPSRTLDAAALGERRERLAKLGGSPMAPARWSLDPVLFGPDPAARARAWVGRRRWAEAEAAFDEALLARPLLAPLWAELARFHADRGRPDRAAEDAARAILLFWSDPGLADLARANVAFRAEALDEIGAADVGDYRNAADVWRGRGRRRASRGDWVGAANEFARPATPAVSLRPPDLLALDCLLRLAGDRAGANRFAAEVRSLPERVPVLFPNGPPIPDTRGPILLWIGLLDDPPPDAIGLIRRAEAYVAKSIGEGRHVLGAALLRAGRLDEAIARFEESLAAQPDWPAHGLNAFGLALAHHRLGRPEEARRWLDRAERWLSALDRTYAADGPRVLTGQPQVPLSFEFWVYAQLLRREAAGPILDAAFPADPFAG
jgi:tetratricopeptide (TPR) repeat protein